MSTAAGRPSTPNPVIIFTAGAGVTPAHTAYVSHLLLQAGFPTLSGLLPSVGNATGAKVTVEDDVKYIRNSLILPFLDIEERDVIIVGHSYSSMPASAAVHRLGKKTRSAEGKKAAVIGQIHVAGLVPKGGDGNSLLMTFGGGYPPHLYEDKAKNIIRCADPVAALWHDFNTANPLAAAAAGDSTLCPNLTCFNSPVPRASWDSDEYKGRSAYIKTTDDHAVPRPIQDQQVQATGVEWIIEEIESAHTPFLSQPEKTVELLVKLAKQWKEL